MFKKSKKCNHRYIVLGYYYELQLTEYKNCFDEIEIIELRKCVLCNKTEKHVIGRHEFLPRKFNISVAEEEDQYIKTLRDRNILEEYELYINTRGK